MTAFKRRLPFKTDRSRSTHFLKNPSFCLPSPFNCLPHLFYSTLQLYILFMINYLVYLCYIVVVNCVSRTMDIVMWWWWCRINGDYAQIVWLWFQFPFCGYKYYYACLVGQQSVNANASDTHKITFKKMCFVTCTFLLIDNDESSEYLI